MSETRNVTFALKSTDQAKQLVTGMVYAPMVLDTTGEFMLPEDLEVAAHRFMQLDLSKVVDTQHNNILNGSYPVESYISRGNPEYPEGSWVVTLKVPDKTVWDKIVSGEINGFSYECMVTIVPHTVEYLVTRDHVGITEVSDGHSHIFFAQVAEDGRVAYGKTETVADHDHEIVGSSRTTTDFGHSHRFFI